MLERLNAISTVHRRLFQSDDAAAFDLAEFLHDLTADLSGASGRDDIALDLKLEPVSVAADQAAPIALMINEVMTNALRHAFADHRPGRLEVSLAREPTGYRVLVQDDGVGRRDRPAGFGSTIIELLGRQLKAQVSASDRASGHAVSIHIPHAPERT